MLIDLHTHSSASDGTQPPAEVLASAAAAGLGVVALTDHDTTAGWEEAARAVEATGVTLARGMEVSTQHEGLSIHVLAYLHDPRHPGLEAEIRRARASRDSRARRIVEALSADVPVTWEDVLAQVGPGATVGRPHIADALVAAGIVPDRGAAFDRYLYTGSPYYASHYAVDPVRAVELVVAAGGVPVLAHPFATGRSGREIEPRLVERMADAGLGAIEAHHPEHTPQARERAVALAGRLGLPVTGSSDYHGAGKPQRLGACTTEPGVFEDLVARADGVALVRP